LGLRARFGGGANPQCGYGREAQIGVGQVLNIILTGSDFAPMGTAAADKIKEVRFFLPKGRNDAEFTFGRASVKPRSRQP